MDLPVILTAKTHPFPLIPPRVNGDEVIQTAGRQSDKHRQFSLVRRVVCQDEATRGRIDVMPRTRQMIVNKAMEAHPEVNGYV